MYFIILYIFILIFMTYISKTYDNIYFIICMLLLSHRITNIIYYQKI